MRIYGSIQTAFWEGDVIQHLSDQSKLLAIYLLTGPHSNMLGCFRLPDGYVVEDLKWGAEHAKSAFMQLAEINFLTRDFQSSWIIVHDFLKWNPVQNPRQGIGIQKLFFQVPTGSTVYKPLVKSILSYGRYLDKEFVNQLRHNSELNETVYENCVTDQEQEQDQNQDQEQNNKIFLSGEPDIDSPSLRSQAMQILHFLNQKTGRVYRPVDTNLKLVMARLKSGATLAQCFQVIAKKTREWKGNPMMDEYLRPATLFNATKFEQYLGELALPQGEIDDESESLSGM